MGRRLAWGMVAVLMLSVGCKKPQTGPDLSSPKAAAKTFTTALERGDVATAKLASSAGGLEVDLVEAMAQSASGIRRLAEVGESKFGPDAQRLVAARSSAEVSKNLLSGDVEQNAQIATIRSKDGQDTMQLRFEGGVWKVDIGALIRGKDISGVVPVFRAAGIAAEKVADDIESGKCKSVDDAMRQMRAQIGFTYPELMRKGASTSPTPTSEPK